MTVRPEVMHSDPEEVGPPLSSQRKQEVADILARNSAGGSSSDPSPTDPEEVGPPLSSQRKQEVADILARHSAGGVQY